MSRTEIICTHGRLVEVKVGCLYTDTETEQSPGVLCAAAPSSLRYVGSVSDAKTFWEPEDFQIAA